MTINPQVINGSWNEGYVLDKHIIESIYLGDNVYGHAQYDTKRSALGELIYQLKYKQNYNKLDDILTLIKPFLDSWGIASKIDVILPIPASNVRDRQPVYELAQKIAEYLNVHCADDVLCKVKSTSAKNMSTDEKEQLEGTIHATKLAVKKHNLLLIDDLYQTGKTLDECVKILRRDPLLENIYVLVMTKTRG